MRKVRLGDYIREYSARNKAEDDIPVYSVTNTQGFCRNYFGKDVASKDRTTYKIVPMGCFAYNPSRINVGSVDWQRYEERVIVSPLYCVFSVSPKLEKQYLYYYLKSDITLHHIKFVATGSVRDNLKLSMLYEFPINLPSIEEQQRIVKRLDVLKDIITLHKQELQTLDTLVKARFVEMFGDMADPCCKHPRCKLVEACVNPDDIKCGPFGTQLSKDEYQSSGVAVWEIPQINSGFKKQPTHYLTIEKAKQLNAYSLFPGDIAMSRKGNVGRCGLLPTCFTPGIIHSDVLRIRVDNTRVDPCFMMCQLHFSRSVQQQIEMVSSGAVMAGINVTKLKQIEVYVPAYDLQTQFAAFVAQVDKSKFCSERGSQVLQNAVKCMWNVYMGGRVYDKL